MSDSYSRCRPDRGEHDRRFARGERGLDGPPLRHHRRGGGGRSGLGRFFAHGDLRLVILHLIAEKPSHGYEIIKAIEDRVAGAYSPSPGVIYPTLTLLEELGYVTVGTTEGARKLHEITDQGRAFLAANQPALDALLARMDEAGRAQGDGPAPQILRAMENLKLALRLRLARGPLDTEQADAVAAALDAAALGVERS
ncbi:MAG: PadR family transcriptional regulator [Geminicoccaceae bacterium]